MVCTIVVILLSLISNSMQQDPLKVPETDAKSMSMRVRRRYLHYILTVRVLMRLRLLFIGFAIALPS